MMLGTFLCTRYILRDCVAIYLMHLRGVSNGKILFFINVWVFTVLNDFSRHGSDDFILFNLKLYIS